MDPKEAKSGLSLKREEAYSATLRVETVYLSQFRFTAWRKRPQKYLVVFKLVSRSEPITALPPVSHTSALLGSPGQPWQGEQPIIKKMHRMCSIGFS
jgi:hypothetical protein